MGGEPAPVWVSWSSGKDSAWLPHLLRGQGIPVTRLVTTVSSPAARVAGHGVPLALRAGVPALFPLWDSDTGELARAMLAGGLRAAVACVDVARLPAELAGRPFDERFLDALPPAVDPCGERGEFHTFAWDGPMFGRPVAVRAEGIEERGGFAFARLRTAGGDPTW